MTDKRTFASIALITAIGLITLLAACIPSAPICPTPQTQSETPTLPTPQELTPTPTPDGCQQVGTVQRLQMQSALLNLTMNVSVYLPPCYDPKLKGGYPAAYLFHGQTFDDRMWIELGAAELADTLILAGEAEPFVMIFPNEEFFYRPVLGNAFPQAIMEELLPWAEENFNLCPEWECRTIGGISRGASWAMRIGMTNPRVFGRIGIHSLPSFLGGEGQVAEWVKVLPKDQLPFVAMDSGRLDPEIKSAIAVEAVLNQQGLPHVWHLNEGRHDGEYWAVQIENYLRWYAGGWENLE
jgi:enterochelin esterase-like enzyme